MYASFKQQDQVANSWVCHQVPTYLYPQLTTHPYPSVNPPQSYSKQRSQQGVASDQKIPDNEQVSNFSNIILKYRIFVCDFSEINHVTNFFFVFL